MNAKTKRQPKAKQEPKADATQDAGDAPKPGANIPARERPIFDRKQFEADRDRLLLRLLVTPGTPEARQVFGANDAGADVLILGGDSIDVAEMASINLLRVWITHSERLRPLPMPDSRLLFLELPDFVLRIKGARAKWFSSGREGQFPEDAADDWAHRIQDQFFQEENLTNVVSAILEIEGHIKKKRLSNHESASALIAAWTLYQTTRKVGEFFLDFIERKEIALSFNENKRPRSPAERDDRIKIRLEQIFRAGQAHNVSGAAKIIAKEFHKSESRMRTIAGELLFTKERIRELQNPSI